MEFLQTYFNLLIVGCCVVVGYVWTTLTNPEDKSRRFIPLVMAVLGIALACIDSGGVSVEIMLSGAVSGLASTGCESFYHSAQKISGLSRLRVLYFRRKRK